MRAEIQKPGAGAETATGSDCKAGKLHGQDTTEKVEVQHFYWSRGGSVERLDVRGVAA